MGRDVTDTGLPLGLRERRGPKGVSTSAHWLGRAGREEPTAGPGVRRRRWR